MHAYLISLTYAKRMRTFVKKLAMKMTQCEIGKIGWLEPNILLVDIEEGTEIGVEHMYEFNDIASKLAKNEQRFNIINYGAYSLRTKEARELCASQKMSELVLARALVVHDLGQFILAKHTLKRQKSSIPTRIFTDLEGATKWVKLLKPDQFENQIVVEKT